MVKIAAEIESLADESRAIISQEEAVLICVLGKIGFALSKRYAVEVGDGYHDPVTNQWQTAQCMAKVGKYHIAMSMTTNQRLSVKVISYVLISARRQTYDVCVVANGWRAAREKISLGEVLVAIKKDLRAKSKSQITPETAELVASF